jgi:hypothetical protein
MSATSVAPAKKRAKTRPARMRVKDARTKVIPPIRCTQDERAAIKKAAQQAGLSVGAFLRALALGDAGPRAVRRPPVERVELARLLGWLGKLGSNVNQLAMPLIGMGYCPDSRNSSPFVVRSAKCARR